MADGCREFIPICAAFEPRKPRKDKKSTKGPPPIPAFRPFRDFRVISWPKEFFSGFCFFLLDFPSCLFGPRLISVHPCASLVCEDVLFQWVLSFVLFINKKVVDRLLLVWYEDSRSRVIGSRVTSRGSKRIGKEIGENPCSSVAEEGGFWFWAHGHAPLR